MVAAPSLLTLNPIFLHSQREQRRINTRQSIKVDFGVVFYVCVRVRQYTCLQVTNDYIKGESDNSV